MSDADNVLVVRNDEGPKKKFDLDNDIIVKTFREMTKLSNLAIGTGTSQSSPNQADEAKPEEVKDESLDNAETEEPDNSEETSDNDDIYDFDLVHDIPVWDIGSDCRATYKEDKLDYEATILDIYHDSTCLIEFLGYANQQVEKLEKLMPSWGTEERKKQLKAAKLYYDNLEESDSSKSTHRRKKQYFKSKARSSTEFNMFGPDLLPPQPPLPPMFANGGPMDDPEQNEALSAMLMSWYMSGYYTGLYHGQLKGKKKI